jgi:hypothetical protein
MDPLVVCYSSEELDRPCSSLGPLPTTAMAPLLLPQPSFRLSTVSISQGCDVVLAVHTYIHTADEACP